MDTVLMILGVAFLAILVVAGGLLFYHGMTKIVKEATDDEGEAGK